MIKYLMKSYNYVQIYAAGAAGYDPHDSNIANSYNKVFGDVIDGSR
ncbi:MAG: hypothetical protein DHS20C13_23400 [Thermodesulfobacteriota bacterium]|nr:MAG: hypothetical protein DHS20C13_23400 [Thermodesulfobacteriota bacterium]